MQAYFLKLDNIHGVGTEAGDIGAGEVQEQLVIEWHYGRLADGEAIHSAVDAPAEGIGGCEALVVPLVEGGVIETRIVGRRREAAVEEGEVGLGIGVVGYPLGAEHETLGLGHLLLEDSGLDIVHIQLDAYVLQFCGYEVYNIGIVIGGLDGDGREAAAVGVACLREQREGFLRVVVVAVIVHSFEAGHAGRNETAGGGDAAAILEIGDDLAAIDGVVDGPTDEDVAGGAIGHEGVGGIGEEAEVFGIEIDTLCEADLISIFGLEAAVFAQHEVFERAVYIIDEVELALEEEEEFDSLGFIETDLDGVEVREGFARGIMLPIVRVAVQDEDIAFVPVLKLEGACAAGVAAVVFAPVVGHFVGDDAAIGHAEYLRQGLEGCAQADLQSGIVEGYEWIFCGYALVEYPGAGGGGFGVDDAAEAVDDISGSHAAAFASGE